MYRIVFTKYTKIGYYSQILCQDIMGHIKIICYKRGTGSDKDADLCSRACKIWTSSPLPHTWLHLQFRNPDLHISNTEKEKLTPYASCCALQTFPTECQTLQRTWFSSFLPSMCNTQTTSHRYGMTKVILTLAVRLDKAQLQVSFQFQKVCEATNGSHVTSDYGTPR